MAYAQTVSLLPIQAHGASQAAGTESTRQQVFIDDLLTPAFVARHSRFTSVDAFFQSSGLDPQDLAALDVRNRCVWDAFVQGASTFPSWDAMLRTARGEWILRRLGVTVDA